MQRHSSEFSTVSPSQIKTTIVDCAQDEHNKLKEKAVKIASVDCSPEQHEEARSWLDGSDGEKSPKEK